MLAHAISPTGTAIESVGAAVLCLVPIDPVGPDPCAEPEDRPFLFVIPADPRPRTRADCVDGPRPCPWVSCRHHLYLEINEETGKEKIRFPSAEPWDLADSCSLDVAGRGGITLEEIGEILNLTRERVRQIEVRGLVQLQRRVPGYRDDD